MSICNCFFFSLCLSHFHSVIQFTLNFFDIRNETAERSIGFIIYRYVQQKTNSPVDMRVGIHTGAILAGILGQRQWQYDVYSKDVELANKMESSGMAGWVYFLHNQIELMSVFSHCLSESVCLNGKAIVKATTTKMIFAINSPMLNRYIQWCRNCLTQIDFKCNGKQILFFTFW